MTTEHGPAEDTGNESEYVAETEFDESFDPDSTMMPEDTELPGPPGPVNWNLLTAEAAEEEWLALNQWVHWLRRTYGLPIAVLPPFWHRHPELVWELSALHLHWLCAYDIEAKGSAPLVWHRDFADARQRLRDWVAASGTRLDTDRPTRTTAWPGETPSQPVEDTTIRDREADFVEFIHADVQRRLRVEDEFFAGIASNQEKPDVPA